MGGRVKPGHDGGGKKKSPGGYRRRGSPVFSLHGRPIEDRLSGQPQSTFASTSPVSMRSPKCCPGASGAGLPLSARGARKLAPLPVCSCDIARSAMAVPFGIYRRTYSEHDVGLSSPIQEKYLTNYQGTHFQPMTADDEISQGAIVRVLRACSSDMLFPNPHGICL